MNLLLPDLFNISRTHQKEHRCGGVPHEHTNLLITLLLAVKAKKILEIGTGIGYSTACIASADQEVLVHTIDKDHDHLVLAQKNWKQLSLSKQITVFEGKAHVIMQNLREQYDVIFFDGYTPQKKFLPDFERLLKKGGLLLTANLFLNNSTGGKYLKELQNLTKWQTIIIADTAVSVKVI